MAYRVNFLVISKVTTIFLQTDDTFLKPRIQVKKVQVGNDQEKAQSEKDSHSKNRGGKKLN